MGLFQDLGQAGVPPASTNDHASADAKLHLLARLPNVRFGQTFRGLDPVMVDRLFAKITSHEPNLRAGIEFRRVNGQFPDDADFLNSVRVLSSASLNEIHSVFRGYDPMQVQRVLTAINELPAHIEVD